MRFPSKRSLGLLAILLALPACGGGGGGGGGGTDEFMPDPQRSVLHVSPDFGTPADGLAEVDIGLLVRNSRGKPIEGCVIELDVSGYGNLVTQMPPTDSRGISVGKLVSFAGERKTIRATVRRDPHVVPLGPEQTVFLNIASNTWFVRTGGSDSNSGRSPLEAWRTIGHALTQVGPRATIHVGAGTYTGPIEIGASSPESPLVLLADPTGTFTGDAGPVVIDAMGAPHAVLIDGAAGVAIRNFHLRGARSGAAPGGGIRVVDSTRAWIFDCQAFDNERGIDVENATELVIEATRCSNNLADGIRLSDSSTCAIEHNLVYANGGNGLVFGAPSSQVSLRLNTFYRNVGHSVLETEIGGTGLVRDNLFVEAGSRGISLLESSGLTSSHNLSWANALVDAPEGGAGTFQADPLLARPAGIDGLLGGTDGADDDFRFQAGSPAFDAGEGFARDTLLFALGPVSTRSSRASGVPDGTLDDGPALNLGFHYPLALDEYESLEHGGARVTWAAAGEVLLRTIAWDRADGTLSHELSPLPFNADVRWVEHRVSPLDRPDEAVAALVDTGTQTQVHVRVWDGWRWTDEFESPIATSVRKSELAGRGFDLEYMQLSGRSVLVRAAAPGGAIFRVLDGGRWTPERPVSDDPLGSGKLLWVELVPRPDSDEIALVALTEEHQIVTSVLDQDVWSSPLVLEENAVFTPGWRPFAASWESLSGDLFVMWGFNVFIEETRWATRDHASGTWTTGQHPSTDAVGAHIEMASDPTSDRIAVVLGEGDIDDDITVSVWGGEAWLDHTAELTLAAPWETHALEVGWVGDSGEAIVLFRREGHLGSFNYALFRPTGWRIQADVVLPGVGRAKKIIGHPVPGEDRLLFLVQDTGGDLFLVDYRDGAFHVVDGGIALAHHDPGLTGIPFSLAVRRP